MDSDVKNIRYADNIKLPDGRVSATLFDRLSRQKASILLLTLADSYLVSTSYQIRYGSQKPGTWLNRGKFS